MSCLSSCLSFYIHVFLCHGFWLHVPSMYIFCFCFTSLLSTSPVSPLSFIEMLANLLSLCVCGKFDRLGLALSVGNHGKWWQCRVQGTLIQLWHECCLNRRLIRWCEKRMWSRPQQRSSWRKPSGRWETGIMVGRAGGVEVVCLACGLEIWNKMLAWAHKILYSPHQRSCRVKYFSVMRVASMTRLLNGSLLTNLCLEK